MKSLVERCGDIWENIRKSPAQIPIRVVIPVEHIDKGEKLIEAFQRNEHYFQIRINEMYLTSSRKWFQEYDPMVLVVSEFIYDKKMEAVPFVVGPTMMKEFEQHVPNGMIFSNTRVAGLHPYRGGRLNLSVVLCSVKRTNYAEKLLQIVESAAGVLDFSTALSNYVKIGKVVLDGIEALLGLGLDNTKPLVGYRREFDPDAGDVVQSNYFALINMPESEFNRQELWVRDHQLVSGKSLEEAKPFRKADYVLYSITQTPERSDEELLSFYPLWERVAQEAMIPKEANWKSAKSNMLSLYQTMMLSPDLTQNQANSLTQKYTTEMKRLYDKAVDIAELGIEKGEASELDKIRKGALNILDM